MSLIPLQHATQTRMTPAESEPALPASERQQTLALNRSAIAIGSRTRDRPACSAMPQLTALLRTDLV